MVLCAISDSSRLCMCRAKGLAEAEKKSFLTEISSHSACAMVTTHSNFDIRFMDEQGSPLEEEYLQVDVTVVELLDFRTEEQLAGDKCVGATNV